MEDKFNAAEFAQKKAKEFKEQLAEKEPAEEVVEEVSEEVVEESTEQLTEEPQEQVEEVSEPEPEPLEEDVEEDTPKEAALKKEIARVKAKLRKQNEVEPAPEHVNLEEVTTTKEVDYDRAELRVFTAWRNEALEDLMEQHPQYKNDPKAWEKFEVEYKDRVPELEYAQRHNLKVTKKLFKERLNRVHRAISDNTSSARSAGKAELLQTQSAAQVMGASSAKGEVTKPAAKAPSKLFPKKDNSFSSWIKKK